jgi:hypothetical protein
MELYIIFFLILLIIILFYIINKYIITIYFKTDTIINKYIEHFINDENFLNL